MSVELCSEASVDVLRAECERLQRADAQHRRDWDALLVEIAKAVGTDEDREAAEMGEVGEFDPWHALRVHGAALVQARTLRDEAVANLSAEFQRRIDAERALRELRALVNSPRIDDFFEGVRIEAAHQVERWGVEHDAGKRPEDWITLYMYLLGKAAKAHFDGNRDKLLHHIITVAAVALNWHRNATGENTQMRPGIGPTEAA